MYDSISMGFRSRGIPSYWSRERDHAMNTKHGDKEFKPNESYREVPLWEYDQPNFPKKYDGGLIKVMSWGLHKICDMPHRIIFMMRDPMKIADSYERSFGEPLCETIDGICAPVEDLEDYGFDSWSKIYCSRVKQIVRQARSRKGCLSITPINYNKLLLNPNKYLKKIQNNGWPIDEMAERVINPERERCTK